MARKYIEFVDGIGQECLVIFDFDNLLEVAYTKERGEVRRVDYKAEYPSETGSEARDWFTFHMYQLEKGLMNHGSKFSVEFTRTHPEVQAQYKLF